MAHQFFFNPYILDNLPAPASGFDVVQDLSEPRLRMYITSRGVKSFFVRKRVNGRDKRFIIGNYPEMDIEDARTAVSVVLANAMQKPKKHRRVMTFKSFLDLYLANRVRRSVGSFDKLIRAINKHFVPLFDKNIKDISKADVSGVINSISGHAIAGRMQELLQSIFKYAQEQGYVNKNPVSELPKIVQQRRVRPLNYAGFARLVNVINMEEDINVRSAFLMLIYGFAPKSKVFSMQWEDLDFNHYMWCDMPLSDRAVVLLQDLPQDGCWVFRGRGRGHLTDPRLAWRRVAKAAGVPNLTMDDVYKFIIHQLVWAPDKEDLRTNMNDLLSNIMV